MILQEVLLTAAVTVSSTLLYSSLVLRVEKESREGLQGGHATHLRERERSDGGRSTLKCHAMMRVAHERNELFPPGWHYSHIVYNRNKNSAIKGDTLLVKPKMRVVTEKASGGSFVVKWSPEEKAEKQCSHLVV